MKHAIKYNTNYVLYFIALERIWDNMNNYFDDLYSEVYEYTYDTITERKMVNTNYRSRKLDGGSYKKLTVKKSSPSNIPYYQLSDAERKRKRRNDDIKWFIKYIIFMIALYKIANKLYKNHQRKEQAEEISQRYGEDIKYFKGQLNKNGNTGGLNEYIEARIKELEKMKDMLKDKDDTKRDIEGINDEKLYLQCLQKVDRMRQQDIPLMEKLGIRKELIKKLKNGWNPNTGRTDAIANMAYKTRKKE